MKKKLILVLVFLLVLCGCSNNKDEKENNISNKQKSNVEEKKSNKETKEEKKDSYKISFENDDKKVNDELTMKIKRVKVSNDAKEESAEKINKYLNKVIDDASVNFEEYLENQKEYVGYTFKYEYSLLEENNKYLVFQLDYEWQAGGPYPTYSSEYYMFDKNTGNIVEFDDLFTRNIKKDVKENVKEKINEIYSKQGDEYTEDLSDDLFINGFYVLNKNKLKFTLPRGYFTSAAYGSLTIDIDEDIYKEYIK